MEEIVPVSALPSGATHPFFYMILRHCTFHKTNTEILAFDYIDELGGARVSMHRVDFPHSKKQSDGRTDISRG